MEYVKSMFNTKPVIGVKTPCDYLYLRILRFSLRSTASWPLKEIGGDESRIGMLFLKYFHVLLCSSCFVSGITYIILNTSSLTFFELGHSYFVIFMTIVNMSRVYTLTMLQRFRNFTKDFLTQIHLYYYKDNSAYAMETHKQVHRLSHILTVFIFTQMLLGIVFYNLAPLYKNYASGKFSVDGNLQNATFEHSVYFSLPYNSSTNLKGYIFTAICLWYISYSCSTGLCMFDTLLSVMVFHVYGHFKILNHKVNNLPKPTNKSNLTLGDSKTISNLMYSKEEQLEVFAKLIECINYHRTICSFTDRMSEVFGPMLFVYYMFHQTSLCLLLLECSQMTTTALVQFVPLTCIMMQQLIQLSVIFELIGSESEKLKDIVYDVPWECMNIKNRRIVHIFLMNVQKPIHVKALGVANVGVTSMATILKTSLSYFTFLRSV